MKFDLEGATEIARNLVRDQAALFRRNFGVTMFCTGLHLNYLLFAFLSTV